MRDKRAAALEAASRTEAGRTGSRRLNRRRPAVCVVRKGVGGGGGGRWRHKNAPVLGIKVTTLKRKTSFVDPAQLSTLLQTSETFSFFSPLFPTDM